MNASLIIGGAFVSLPCFPSPESSNEMRTPTNASESILIQLRCLKMHNDCVTNYIRYFQFGNAWPKF